MTAVTVRSVDQADDALPPPGTAIVRPLRHVRNVREQHLRRFDGPSEIAGSRAARAWAWALGESATAPVTDRQTRVPPRRKEIEREIAVADERRLRGEREKRADAAATILRWLVGADDRVPVRCENPGELVGGFGDVVRSREQISDLLASATEGQCRAEAASGDTSASPTQRQRADQHAEYLKGVAATLSWVLGEADSPITGRRTRPAARDLKNERVHAEDVLEQAASPRLVDPAPPPWYGEGVESTITWLLGNSSARPVGPKQPR